MKDVMYIFDFINKLTEPEVSEILFGRSSIGMEAKRRVFQKSLKEKFELECGKMKDKHYEYFSELITNLLSLKNLSAKSILYKAPDSTGYDGVFMVFDTNWNIFVSETKSSDTDYDTSKNNNLNYKSDEALSDLNKKFLAQSTGAGSTSRWEDNVNIEQNVEVIISKDITHSFTDEQKGVLKEQYLNIIDGRKINNAISSTVSKSNPDFSPLRSTKDHLFDKVIHNNLIINNSGDITKAFCLLVKKFEEFYG